MSFTSSAGWHVVIVEHWPDDVVYGQRKAPGEVSVVRRLAPWDRWPDQAWFDQLEQVYARYGGVAKARVVAMHWYGYPMLTEVQQRAAAGLP